MTARVRELAIAPVKGMRLIHPAALELDADGASEDRRFYCVGGPDRRLQHAFLAPRLAAVIPGWDPCSRELSLRFPDGTSVSGVVDRVGDRVGSRQAWPGGRTVPGRVVLGPWSEAISAHVGRPVELVMAIEGTGAHDVSPVTLLSDATV